MRGRRETIHSDEPGDDDEPKDTGWFKGKGKRGRKVGKRKEAVRPPGPVIGIENEPAMVPAVYPGDPTEQEVIDNVQDLTDIQRGGKVRVIEQVNGFEVLFKWPKYSPKTTS